MTTEMNILPELAQAIGPDPAIQQALNFVGVMVLFPLVLVLMMAAIYCLLPKTT